MVRQTQKVDQLRESKGVLGEGSLRQQKENGWGWLSKITAIFKGLGRPRLADQVREEIVRDGGAVLAKKSNTGAKPSRVRSHNKSQASRKSTGKTVRAPAQRNKSKSKTVQKG
jgi:hypothetical protein